MNPVSENLLFTDHYGNPWPRGTVLEVPSLFNHQGIVDYAPWTGEQVMLHNSKQRMRGAATSTFEFSEGRPYIAVRLPGSPEEGEQVAVQARMEIERGVFWSWLDNCQDFVTRPYNNGKNGSKTRDFFLGTSLVVAIIASL